MVENGVTTNFDYDNNGNLTQKQIVDGETWNYFYDFQNRLIEVKKNSVTIQRNWYDGDSKRIRKVVIEK
jgi:YD repeat-containing protein